MLASSGTAVGILRGCDAALFLQAESNLQQAKKRNFVSKPWGRYQGFTDGEENKEKMVYQVLPPFALA